MRTLYKIIIIQTMKKFFLALALIGLGTGIFATSEAFADIVSMVKSPTESEIALIILGNVEYLILITMR